MEVGEILDRRVPEHREMLRQIRVAEEKEAALMAAHRAKFPRQPKRNPHDAYPVAMMAWVFSFIVLACLQCSDSVLFTVPIVFAIVVGGVAQRKL